MANDNYFNLPDPENWGCQVWGYLKSHSVLIIQLQADSETSCFLEFAAVEYFEGSIVWQGANFSLAPPDECLRIIRRTGRFNSISDDYLLSHLRLFTVNSDSESPIKILAANGMVSDSYAKLFKFRVEG